MNFIQKKASNLVELRLSGNRLGDHKKLLKIVEDDLYSVDSDTDKLSYLTIVLEGNDAAYQEHLKVCTNPKACQTNEHHEEIDYVLKQEIRRLGVVINDDSFSRDEKERMTEYLDKILKDLKDLKDGQQIIYDDLKAEIEELKQWFILGKKNWRQMFVGKFGEMVAGGVISEVTAKPLVESIKGTIHEFLAIGY